MHRLRKEPQSLELLIQETSLLFRGTIAQMLSVGGHLPCGQMLGEAIALKYLEEEEVARILALDGATRYVIAVPGPQFNR